MTKMQRITSHIEYLLEQHDCVIVPGFGAFIKRHEPASIDKVNGMIYPPHRSVSFNSDLKYDDGLLVSSYSRATGMPYTTASGILHKDIEHLKSTLNNSGELSLQSIGTLHIKDRLINFTPARSAFMSFGLNSLKLTPVNQESQSTQSEPKILAAPNSWHLTMQRAMRYAAMLIAFLSIGILLSNPLNDRDSRSIAKASLNILDAAAPAETDELSQPEFLIAEPIEDPIPTAQVRDSYCLIIASLATPEQADKFIQQEKQFVKGMFESNGRYRVYAATGPTVASVMNQELMARYEGAWPCSMP